MVDSTVRHGQKSVAQPTARVLQSGVQFLPRVSATGLVVLLVGKRVPYVRVRQQLLCVWRAVDRARRLAGYDSLPIDCVPWRRKIVNPFREPGGIQSGHA